MAAFLLFLFVGMIIQSAAFAESYLYVEERMAVLSKKIEDGVARGSLTKNEQGRLKTRFVVLKHKSDKYKKQGATTTQYLQLERELTGLEKDTERLMNSLKRR
jgi:hypothetical protein